MPIKHLAIILDGNRRWAKENGLPSFEGHRRGYENVKAIGLAALERGVEHFTAFAFSTENWKRGEEEVGYLMDLLHRALTAEIDFYQKNNVRLRVIGRRLPAGRQGDGLSETLVTAIDEAEARTAGNTRGQFNLCVNYGGRAEILDAIKLLAAEGMRPEDITEERVASRMWTAGLPDPDLIIRTSGERRLSGFLTWLGTYSELLFADVHWPAFTEEHLDAAIAEFDSRQRRFGR